MKHFLEVMGDALIVFFGITVSMIFVPILKYGRYYIYEGNIVVLWIEIILAGLIILFGIYLLINDLKKG